MITEEQINELAIQENRDQAPWPKHTWQEGFKAGMKKAIELMQQGWISVKDMLPEDNYQLVKNPDEDDVFMPLTTSNVLVLTDLGTVINNSRFKMMIGANEWRWTMGLIQWDGSTHIFDGETITHWTYMLPEPPKTY